MAENLKKAEASKGTDSLLDESFKNDVARTTVAKEITRNIEKALIDGDIKRDNDYGYNVSTPVEPDMETGVK